MMEQLCSRSILHDIRAKNKSDLSKLIFIGRTTFTNQDIIEFFNETGGRASFTERVTGLMLVYPNHTINLVESSENEIFQVSSNILNVQPKIFSHTTYFIPIDVNGQERFFDEWYVRKAIDFRGDFPIENEPPSTAVVNFEQRSGMYRDFMKSFYVLLKELRDEARTKTRTRLLERLDDLGTLGDARLPREKTLGALLDASHWGESLEKFVFDYRNGIRSREIDDEIWPFPRYQCPPIQFQMNSSKSY